MCHQEIQQQQEAYQGLSAGPRAHDPAEEIPDAGSGLKCDLNMGTIMFYKLSASTVPGSSILHYHSTLQILGGTSKKH